MSARTSVATRLAASALVVCVGSLVVATLVLASGAYGSGEELLRQRIAATGTAKATEIEAYFARLERQVATLAASRTVEEGLSAFATSYHELAAGSMDDLSAERAALAGYYLDDLIPELKAAGDPSVDPLRVAPVGEPAAVYLQNAYLAQNPFAMDEGRLVTDAEDGSAWTAAHREFHPPLRRVADTFDLADILFIDAETEAVVYSVAKDIDFATDLGTGPHRGSALAGLVDQVMTAGRGSEGVRSVAIADYSFYPPALDGPALFLAAPVRNARPGGDGGPVGVVAVRVSTRTVNEIMTRDWRAGRFGETGETYLVGTDRLMRSDSRAFDEDPAGYLERLDVPESGVTAADRRRMRTLDTTVLLQKIASPAVIDATAGGETELVDETGYPGTSGPDVVTAYRPVDVSGLDWALLAQAQRTEVYRPVDGLLRTSLTATTVFVVALTLLIVLWANVFTDPIRAVSAALKRAGDGDLDARLVGEGVAARGTAEFRELASDADRMIGDLGRRERRLSAMTNTKLDLIRRLLPPLAAQRVGAGDRRLLETIPAATVAVLVLEGLDAIVAEHPADRSRELLRRARDEADRLTGVHGLERVKVQGDTYIAVCGSAAPYLDHTTRAVAYAVATRSAVRRLAAEAGVDLDLSAGVQCGPVKVGLIGDSRLVYDVWGDTAGGARRLSEMAGRRGRAEILVSSQVYDRLPPDTVAERIDGDEADLVAWAVATEADGTRT